MKQVKHYLQCRVILENNDFNEYAICGTEVFFEEYFKSIDDILLSPRTTDTHFTCKACLYEIIQKALKS